MEFLRLFYPKATFPTLSVSGELQASRFPYFPWLKIPRQNPTSQNILRTHSSPSFSITYRQRGQSPKLLKHSPTSDPTNGDPMILMGVQNYYIRMFFFESYHFRLRDICIH